MATDTATPIKGTAGGGRKSLSYIRDDVVFYEHQIDGVRELVTHTSFILADDMGLGKSLQSLTVAAVDFERDPDKTILIVAPATLKWNWEQEIIDHTAFTSMVLDGPPKKRGDQLAAFPSSGCHILIVNYEQVEPHLAALNAMKFDIVIFDEAHAIKNPKARRTKAAHALNIRRSFLLTGSPLLNQTNDLWGLLHRVDPEEFPSYWRFVNRYCNTPDAPIWMADGTFKPIGKVQVGDEVLGWETSPGGRRTIATSTVKRIESRIAPEIIEAQMSSGRTIRCTPDHVWLSGNHNPTHEWVRIMDNPVRKGVLSAVVDVLPDPTPEQQRAADWLGGVYDGEGSRYFVAQCPNHNPAVYARIGRSLDVLDIPYTAQPTGYSLRGGRTTWLKMLNWCNVERRDWFLSRLQTQLNRTKDAVVKVTPQGPGEVVSMETTTGNYIAWGLASRNCIFGGYKDKQIVGVKNKPELAAILERYMVRRLKKNCLDLPDKQHIPVYVDFHPTQAKYYKQAEDELKIDLPDNPTPMEMENALSKMLRLKQICGTPFAIGAEDHSYKLDRAIEMIEEITAGGPDTPGEPVVVFTQFRGVQEAMRMRLEALGIPAYIMNGDTPKQERVPMVTAWANHDTPAVMIAMLQVGAVGLNMTAAKKCIFLDKLWTPKMNEQAEDRLHRIGADTSQPVQIYEIIVRKSVEQRIETILRRKTKLFVSLIEGSPEWKRALMAAIADE